MHYDKHIYRPPSEAYTSLLQITTGCSHNKCTFCNMYKDVAFKISPMEEIIEDLEELRIKRPNMERIYLLNGDPFVIEFKKLVEIIELIRSYLPKLKIISMYSSINNIKSKTVEELKILRSLGVNMIYIGIESGHDEVLKHIVKGNTKKEAINELKKLDEANIEYKPMVMLGIAGHSKAIENAVETAKLFNEVNPRGIFCLSTTLIEGTKLHDEFLEGKFIEATEYERILETRTLLENLNLKKKTRFNSSHVSNTLVLDGFLPEDKERLILQCDEILNSYTEEEFQREFDRHNLMYL